jgi:hypothetical protein
LKSAKPLARQKHTSIENLHQNRPKFLRQSFHEFGAASIRLCPWAHACYEAQRVRGKGYHAAVRAVAFKWIRILFACWKQRLPYNPELYLQALQTRGSAYAKVLTENGSLACE